MNIHRDQRLLTELAVDVTVECFDDLGMHHHIDTILRFNPADAYAVSMTFLTSDGDLTWTFGRDLLIDGLIAPTGDGDVHVNPAVGEDGRAMIEITLTSPDGRLVLQARAEAVSAFLARTLTAVPRGAETTHLDIDGMINALLEI